MTLIPVTNNTGRPERIGTQQAHNNAIPIELLEVDAGVMIQGRYGPNEYCDGCARHHLKIGNPVHRKISVYEVLTSYRRYRCCVCRKPLWQPENQQRSTP
jgi:hypothetical protein